MKKNLFFSTRFKQFITLVFLLIESVANAQSAFNGEVKKGHIQPCIKILVIGSFATFNGEISIKRY
jgi:hypothetical protein